MSERRGEADERGPWNPDDPGGRVAVSKLSGWGRIGFGQGLGPMTPGAERRLPEIKKAMTQSARSRPIRCKEQGG